MTAAPIDDTPRTARFRNLVADELPPGVARKPAEKPSETIAALRLALDASEARIKDLEWRADAAERQRDAGRCDLAAMQLRADALLEQINTYRAENRPPETWHAEVCEMCRGEGKAMVAKLYPSGHTEYWEKCEDCDGNGAMLVMDP